MHRRDLLKALAAAPLLAHAGSLLAAPATDAKLLFVFLRGGYDANNLLVPVGSDFYYAARPNIARYLQSKRRIAFNEEGIFRHYPELDG